MAEQDPGYELLAAFDPETGAFIDLVRSGENGLSFRERGSWEALPPADMRLDGAEIVEVDASFAAVVDHAQAARTSPSKDEAKSHEAFEGKGRG